MKIKYKDPNILHRTHTKYTIWGFVFLIFISFYNFNENLYLSPTSELIVCFFLILTFGISHGAFDHEKGRKLLKIYKIKNISIFYFIYIALGILTSALWFFFPSFILIIFLIVASYHFGKEDCIYPGADSNLLYILKGSIIVLAPLIFHFEKTINIFKELYLEKNILENTLIYLNENNFFVFFLLISFLSNFLISKIKRVWVEYFLEFFMILVINILFHPIIAFTIYFCFLHSIRHSISLVLNINGGFKTFFKKTLPLTIVTSVIFIISVYFLKNNSSLDSAVIKVIFIGLASLTFPHILLEYLIEKNDKQRN